jgi:ribosome-binding protein aMBF1 (putative translation factor)
MAVDMQELLRRKEEIMSGRIKPEDCDKYQKYLPEATKDVDLAIYYFRSDAILDLMDERRKQGLSQKDIAERMGVEEEKVYDFEWYEPRITTIPFLVKYAMALNKRLTIQIEDNKYENTNTR